MNIAGYRTLQLLGKGAMSEIYEVENLRTGAHLALKLYSYGDDEEEVRRRFETEGRLLALLSHPRIVKVLDIGVEPESGKPYFVMDLIRSPDGSIRTLADVPDGEADEETVGKWYDDIRDGLAYIHGKGIIHRDLKLENILIGADGHAVITDFGISKVFSKEDPETVSADPVQTIVRVREGRNLVMGSIGYMAPELEMGVAASEKSDWYALGIIVYKLLTGTWCDSRTDVAGMLETYDPAWRRIIPRLLHSNPQGRECLSYAEETGKDRLEREAALEEKYLREKQRGHNARHVARYAAAASVALVVAGAFFAREHFSQKAMWRLKMESSLIRPAAPPFQELFRIPAEAKADPRYADSGEMTMPSRQQFEAAQIDALILSQPTLSRLEAGDITVERAISEFERIVEQLDNDSGPSPFDNLHVGDANYMPLGDTEPLKMLFEQAVEKLKSVAEQ